MLKKTEGTDDLITQKREPNHVFPNELKQKSTPGKYSQLKTD